MTPPRAPSASNPAPGWWRAVPVPPMRFAAIWLALLALLALSAIFVPRSILPSSILPIIAFAAFLALAAMGEALVLMTRGIDLSIPAVITLSSTVLLAVSGGRDEGLAAAIPLALACAAGIGLVNGVLVALFRLNALIVTLAVGAVTAGATLWYRQGMAQESRVPPLLAEWGGSRILGLNVSVWITLVLVLAATLVLRHTVVGRRFQAMGANPRAALIAGINVPLYRIGAYATAGLLYGIAGLLLSAFIRNPTLDVGNAYLLAPIAAAVLAGTAITGGIGSMVAVAGAALFLTQLGQVLKMLGLSTAIQYIVHGLGIALGMALAEFRLNAVTRLLRRR